MNVHTLELSAVFFTFFVNPDFGIKKFCYPDGCNSALGVKNKIETFSIKSGYDWNIWLQVMSHLLLIFVYSCTRLNLRVLNFLFSF